MSECQHKNAKWVNVPGSQKQLKCECNETSKKILKDLLNEMLNAKVETVTEILNENSELICDTCGRRGLIEDTKCKYGASETVIGCWGKIIKNPDFKEVNNDK